MILGGGYGGVYTALRLQKAARRGRIDLSLVSQENFFLSQPMLAEVVSGSIEPPHIVNPIRRLLPHVHFHQAEIESVEPDSRNVVINYRGDSTQYNRIPYDHLVVAVGSSTDLSSLPGMAEHAFPFKTIGDAFFLRNHVISTLEEAEVETDPDQKAELLTFVVAGGGYTGVEVAAEINSFTREAVKSYSRIDPKEISVILLHRGSRILPVLSDKLAGFSHRALERRGLEIRLGASIKSATAQSAILSDGDAISTRTLVAAIGTAPNPLLSKIPIQQDYRGRVVTEETLAVPEHSGIWAVGDCAAVPDVRMGGTCPPTAQYAMRQAKHVARNILASINGDSLRPFSYRNLGVFVPLGRFSAAADIMGLNVSGFLAWWLYRTYYLYQLPRPGPEGQGGDRLDPGTVLPPRYRAHGHCQKHRDLQGTFRRGRDNISSRGAGTELLYYFRRNGAGDSPGARGGNAGSDVGAGRIFRRSSYSTWRPPHRIGPSPHSYGPFGDGRF